MVETKNLTKSFKNQTVVSDINLNIPKGAIYGLLGPNGAGKSTTLKMLTGVFKQTKGEILFDGHKWAKSDLQHIGALIETPPLYSNLTARENLVVRSKLLDIKDYEDVIDDVLKKVGLEHVGKKTVKQFSMGMKQRLGIAVALINTPKLLILDEPTNGLDPLGIEELRNLMKQLSSEGITIILSSHILSEVEQVADYIGIICKGKLEYEAKINTGVNLEKIFMAIVKKNRDGSCNKQIKVLKRRVVMGFKTFLQVGENSNFTDKKLLKALINKNNKKGTDFLKRKVSSFLVFYKYNNIY